MSCRHIYINRLSCNTAYASITISIYRPNLRLGRTYRYTPAVLMSMYLRNTELVPDFDSCQAEHNKKQIKKTKRKQIAINEVAVL